MRQENDNFWVGFMIGAIVPVVGYLIIGSVFDFLSARGIMDEVTVSTGGQRQRTVLLLSIAFNLLSVNILSKVNRRGSMAIKGVVTATFIYAGYWVYMYYSILLGNF